MAKAAVEIVHFVCPTGRFSLVEEGGQYTVYLVDGPTQAVLHQGGDLELACRIFQAFYAANRTNSSAVLPPQPPLV